MTSSGGSNHVLVRGALIVAVAALVGVIAGHFLWGASPALRLTPATNRAFRPFGLGSGSTGRAGESGAQNRSGGGQSGYGGGLFGEAGETGGRASEPGGPGEQGGSGEGGSGEGESGEGRGASGSGGVSSSITSKVDPGLVDINTVLGLEGAEAAGTGMVVTSQGEVITNNHVISGATKITATDIGNGTTYTAHVVGYDHNHDIAVLQLEGASGLKTESFSGSSLQVGQTIATIGNAGGAGGTPSAAGGRVAAVNQSITAGDDLDGTQEQLSGLIQLSGDLQPGDSGGPLVNSNGEVVGMDTAASSTFQFESSANEGFAIPISDVATVANQIHEGQSSSTVHIGATGMLGVLIQSQGSEGAVIEDVLSETPAASSGLAAGDVITTLDGARVSSPTELTDRLLEKHPGDSVTVAWQTPEGAHQTATLTLASGPPQ